MAGSISSMSLSPSEQLREDYKYIRSGVDVSKALESMRDILDTYTPEQLGMKPEEYELFLQYASSMGPTIDVLDTTISSSGSEKPSISSADLRELEGQIKVTLMNHIGSLGSLNSSYALNGDHFKRNEKVQHFLKLVKANLIKLAETSLDESLKNEIYTFNEQTNSKELLSQLNALLEKINDPKSGLHILNTNSVLKRELDTLHRYFLAIKLVKNSSDSSKQDLLYSELLFLNSAYEQQKLVEALFENGNETELKNLFKGLFKNKDRGSSTERLKVARQFIEMLTEAKQDERFKSRAIQTNIQTIIDALSDDILSLIIDVTASEPQKGGQYEHHINFLWNVLVGGGIIDGLEKSKTLFIDTLKSNTSFSDLKTLLNSKKNKIDTFKFLKDLWSAFHIDDVEKTCQIKSLLSFYPDKLAEYKEFAESDYHLLFDNEDIDKKITKLQLDKKIADKIIGRLALTYESFEKFQSDKQFIDDKLTALGPNVEDKSFSGKFSFRDVVYLTLFQRLPDNIKQYITEDGLDNIDLSIYYSTKRTHNFSTYCQSLISKEKSDGLTGIVEADWELLQKKGMKVAFQQLLNHLNDDDKKKTDGSTVIEFFFEEFKTKFQDLTNFQKLQCLDMLYRLDESCFKTVIDKLDNDMTLGFADFQFLRSGFIDSVQQEKPFAVSHDFKLRLNKIILEKEKKEIKEKQIKEKESSTPPSTTISLRDIKALEQEGNHLKNQLNDYQQGHGDLSDLMKRWREFEKLCLYHKKHHLGESYKTRLDTILEDFFEFERNALVAIQGSNVELYSLHLELLEIRNDSSAIVGNLLERLNKKAPTVPIELRYLFDHVKHSVVQKSFKDALDQVFEQQNTKKFVDYINDHAAFITATPELACDFLDYFTEKCSAFLDSSSNLSKTSQNAYNLLAAMFMNVESDLSGATVLDQLLSKAESAQHRQAVLPNFYRSFAGLIARSSKEGTGYARMNKTTLDAFFASSIRGLALGNDDRDRDVLHQKIDLKSIEWLAKHQSKLDVFGVKKRRTNKKNKTQFPTYEFNKLLNRFPFLGVKSVFESGKVDFFDPFFQRLDVKTQDFILKHVFSPQYHIDQTPKKKVEADYKCLRNHLKTYDKRKPKQHHIIVSMFEAFDKANKGQSLGSFSSITYIVDDLEKFLLKDIVHNQGHVLRDLLKKLDENGFLYKEILKSTAAIFTAKGSISPGSGHRRPDYYYENFKEFVRVSALDPELSSKINTFYSKLIEKVSYDGGADVKGLMDAFNIKAKGKRLSKDYFYNKLQENGLKGQNGQPISRSRADSLYDFFIKKGYLTIDGRVSESGFPNKFDNFEVLDGLSTKKEEIFNIVKNFNNLSDTGANSSFLLELKGFNLDGLNRLIENGYIRKVGHKWEVLRYVDFNASLQSRLAEILQNNFDESVDYFWNQVSDSDSYLDINYKCIVIEFLKRRDYIRDNQLYFHEDHNLEEIASSIGRILKEKDSGLDSQYSQYSQDKIKNHLTQLATSFSVQSPKQVQLMQHLIRSTEGQVFLDTSSKQSRASFARHTSTEHSMALDQSIRRAGDMSDKSSNYSMLNDWMQDSNINETAMVISTFFNSNSSQLKTIQDNILYGLSHMSLDQLAKLLLNTHLSETARNRILDSIDVLKLASLSDSLETLYNQSTYENNYRELFQCLDTIKSIAYRRNLRGDKNQINIQLKYIPNFKPFDLDSENTKTLKRDFITSFSNFTNQPPSSDIFKKMIEFLNTQNLDLQRFLSLASSMTLASDSRRGYVGLFLKAISEEAKFAGVSVSECLLSQLYKPEDFNHHLFEHQMRSLFRLMKKYNIEVDLKKEFDFLDLSFHAKLKRIEEHSNSSKIKNIPDDLMTKLQELKDNKDVDKLGGILDDLSRFSLDRDCTPDLPTLDGLPQESGRFFPRDNESNLGDEALPFGDEDSIAGG